MYDFSWLDVFIDHLMNIRLYPVIEFMGNPSNLMSSNLLYSNQSKHHRPQNASSIHRMWSHLTYQLVERYIGKYLLVFNLLFVYVFKNSLENRFHYMEVVVRKNKLVVKKLIKKVASIKLSF